jgi:serine/threonine protein phosphatase PrpC
VADPNGCFYVKGRLQPTRALGDYHLKFSHLYRGPGKFNGPYIKNAPDIKIIPVNQKFQKIVVASDGVWDFLNKKSVAEASLEPNPHEKILEMALRRIAEKNRKSIEEIKEISAE